MNSDDMVCDTCAGPVFWSEAVQRYYHAEPKTHRVLRTIAREVRERGDMEPAGLSGGSDGETHHVSYHHGARTQPRTRHESGESEPAVPPLDTVVQGLPGDRPPDETDRS